MKNYTHVLGVSLAIDQKEPVDKFFWILITDFDAANFIIISETDDRYPAYLINSAAVEEKVMSFIESSRRKFAATLMTHTS